MISDAVDTVITLGWALAAWIVLCAVVATAALYTLAVTVWAPVQAAREAVAGAVAAERALRALPEHPAPRNPPQSHTAPPCPTWAHTEQDTAA